MHFIVQIPLFWAVSFALFRSAQSGCSVTFEYYIIQWQTAVSKCDFQC